MIQNATPETRPHCWESLTSQQLADTAQDSFLHGDAPILNPRAFGQLVGRAGLPMGLAKSYEYPEVAAEVCREVHRQERRSLKVRRWEDTGEIHGVLSPRYEPIHTLQLANHLEQKWERPVLVKQDLVGATLDSIRVPLVAPERGRRGEPVTAGVEFTQGCVGNRRAIFSLYIEIEICTNGMVSKESLHYFDSTHTRGIRMGLWRALNTMSLDSIAADSVSEIREFQRIAEVARNFETSRLEMVQLLSRSPVTGEALPESAVGGDEAPITAWDVSQHINDSSRFEWASEGRVDAGHKSRAWLDFIDAEVAKAA